MSAYRILEDINQLTLEKFEDCMCDQAYEVLTIEGEPPAEALGEAWTNIYYQYCDLNKDAESLYVLELKREIALQEGRIKLIECNVVLLQVSFNEELLQSLKSLGIRINGISPEKEDYSRRLKQILATLAPKKLAVREKIKELQTYLEGVETGVIDRSYFVTMRSRISKYQGYRIDPKVVMVPEFVTAVKDYLTEMKSRKQKSVPQD